MWKFEFQAPYGDQCKKLGWMITTLGENGWWSKDEKIWKNNVKGGNHSTHTPCKTFKAFQRHLRKHKELQAEGAEVILVSFYEGYDITATFSNIHDKGEK